MKKSLFDIRGMHCAACQAAVERAVRKRKGVSSVRVNLADNSMIVEYDPAELTEQEIAGAVARAGFEALPRPSGTPPRISQDNAVDALTRIWIPLAFLIPLSLLSAHCMPWLPRWAFLQEHPDTVRLLSFLLLLPVLYCERSFFISGFRALLNGSPDMDTLVAAGSGAGVLYGLLGLFRIVPDSGTASFEAAAMILVLVSIGKHLEDRTKKQASDAISKLMKLAPETASVERDGKEFSIPSGEIRKGDIVLMRPGTSVPVDGIVTEGHAAVDQSAVTGESVPVEKSPGDHVAAGTLNADGFFKFRAERVGADTTLAKIVSLVAEAGSAKLPSARIADKVSRVFVPAVLSIAVITFAVWLLCGAPLSAAVSYGMTVLLISCPCALGLATPLAVMAGTGRAARAGLVFRSGEALETLSRTGIVIFDKTGTLTQGKPSVVRWITAHGVPEERLIRTAAALEKKSRHPFASAVLESAEQHGLEPADTAPEEDFETVPGRGVAAKSGNTVRLGGSARFIEERLALHAPSLLPEISGFENEGKTLLYFAENNTLLGAAVIGDPVRKGAPAAVRALEKMNIPCVMLTGDNRRTAAAVAGQIGIRDVEAEILPDDKERIVRSYQDRGICTVMAGDGINDAPALARADAGIAMGGGADIALESADVVLMNGDPGNIPFAVMLSQKVVRCIRLNLFWAFFYNVLGIPLAAGVFQPLFGWTLHPVWGAAAMSASSLCVCLNALHLRYAGLRK